MLPRAAAGLLRTVHARRRLCTPPNPPDPAAKTYRLGIDVQEPFQKPIIRYAGVKTEGAKIDNIFSAAWNAMGLFSVGTLWFIFLSEREPQRCCCGANH